jgi:hypothetical protein
VAETLDCPEVGRREDEGELLFVLPEVHPLGAIDTIYRQGLASHQRMIGRSWDSCKPLRQPGQIAHDPTFCDVRSVADTPAAPKHANTILPVTGLGGMESFRDVRRRRWFWFLLGVISFLVILGVLTALNHGSVPCFHAYSCATTTSNAHDSHKGTPSPTVTLPSSINITVPSNSVPPTSHP